MALCRHCYQRITDRTPPPSPSLLQNPPCPCNDSLTPHTPGIANLLKPKQEIISSRTFYWLTTVAFVCRRCRQREHTTCDVTGGKWLFHNSQNLNHSVSPDPTLTDSTLQVESLICDVPCAWPISSTVSRTASNHLT